VLSWVPDEVKEALFTVCVRALAPDGLALISYNTYPGWKQREAIRELMLLYSADAANAGERLAAARSTLDTLESVLASRTQSHAALNREIIASMRKKQMGHFYHDDLDGVNDPCYFLRFTDWASEHGLHFVAEAAHPLRGLEQLPPSLRATLAELPRLQVEQHLDFATNRTFRPTISTTSCPSASSTPAPANNSIFLPIAVCRLPIWKARGRTHC
jgi:SAM-dependent methyltransferase